MWNSYGLVDGESLEFLTDPGGGASHQKYTPEFA